MDMRGRADDADFFSEESSKHAVADSIAIRIRIKADFRAYDPAGDGFMKWNNPGFRMVIPFALDGMSI